MTTHLSVCNLSKKYHYSDYLIFDNLSFSVLAGEKVTLLIDSQSGKTTLCKLILGLEKPSSGEILFWGKDAEKILPSEKNIAYLAENLILFENKTVLFNLMFPLKVRKVKKHAGLGIALSEAEKFGVENLLNTKVKKLTFSERLKVALARVQIRNPEILLIDSLFEACSKEDFCLLKKFVDNFSKTVVVLTAESKLALGKTMVFSDGKIAFCGSAKDAQEFQKNLLWLYKNSEEQHE